MSSIGYQIFDTEEEFDQKESAICQFLGIPNVYGTQEYWEKIKHFSADQWCGAIEQILVDACVAMTPAERAVYYDPETLVSAEDLISNGWFPADP